MSEDESAFAPNEMGRALVADEVDQWLVAIVCDQRLVVKHQLDESFQKGAHIVGGEFRVFVHENVHAVDRIPREGMIFYVIQHLVGAKSVARYTEQTHAVSSIFVEILQARLHNDGDII